MVELANLEFRQFPGISTAETLSRQVPEFMNSPKQDLWRAEYANHVEPHREQLGASDCPSQRLPLQQDDRRAGRDASPGLSTSSLTPRCLPVLSDLAAYVPQTLGQNLQTCYVPTSVVHSVNAASAN